MGATGRRREIAVRLAVGVSRRRLALKKIMLRIVEVLQNTIDVLDFWKKPIEVKKLRGNIDTEILLADIPALTANHERIAVEIVKVAEKRHAELIK